MTRELKNSTLQQIFYGLTLGVMGALSCAITIIEQKFSDGLYVLIFGLLLLTLPLMGNRIKILKPMLLSMPLAILITVCGALAAILSQHGSIDAWLKIFVVETYKHDFSFLWSLLLPIFFLVAIVKTASRTE